MFWGRVARLILGAGLAIAVLGAGSGAQRVSIVAVQRPVAGVGAAEIVVEDDVLLAQLKSAPLSSLRVIVDRGGATVTAVRNVQEERGRVYTVFAFDQSASFKGSWTPAFALARDMAAALPTDGSHTVEVVTFGKTLEQHGSASSSAKLVDILGDVEASGATQPFTRLRNFIRESSDLARARLPLADRGLRQVVVFTDAGEESKAFSVQDVVTKARQDGVRVHVVTFPAPQSSRGSWAQRYDEIGRIAAETGGLHWMVSDVRSVVSTLKGVMDGARRAFWIDLAFCGLSQDEGLNPSDHLSLELIGPSGVLASAAKVDFVQNAEGPALEPCSAATPAPVGIAEAPAAGSSWEGLPWWLYLAAGLLLLVGLGAYAMRRSPSLSDSRLPLEPVAPLLATTPIPETPAPEPTPQPPPPVAGAWQDPFVHLPETHVTILRGPAGMDAYYRIHRSPFSIGARQDAGVDLVIDHPGVSGKHATIQVYPKGAVFVVDEGSTNGTWIGDRRLGGGERVSVSPGTEIGLGRHVQLRIDQPRQAGARPPEVAPASRPQSGPAEPAVAPAEVAQPRRSKARTIIAPFKKDGES